jgi:NAD+ kinase
MNRPQEGDKGTEERRSIEKLFIYVRPRDWTTTDTFRYIYDVLQDSGLERVVNREYADLLKKQTGITVPAYETVTPEDITGHEMMISFGGDGTFLNAMRTLRGLPMPLAGVNSGRLGFLASIPPFEFHHAIEKIKKGDFTVGRRTMLTAEGDFPSAPDFPHALNEFTLHRHTADMIEVEVSVDGQMLAVVRADGVIASTPTGSTAYSMSAGGPMVAPECDCFVLMAIAPHNFSIRPMVVPDTSTVEMTVRTRGKAVLASLDNSSFIVGDGAHFTVRRSNFYAFLAQTQNISFYDTLRDRIMWGVDRRDTPLKTFGFSK